MSDHQRRRPPSSRLPRPSLRPRRDYAASSSRASPDVHPLPSSYATANRARPSAIPRYVGPRNSTTLPSSAPQPFTWPSRRNSNSTQTTAATASVGQYSAHLPSHLDRSEPTHRFQQSTPENTGMFYQPRDFTLTGTFVDASSITYNASSNLFMKELLEKIIPGAAHDSSARDPPPRCQPGTRLAILDRCLCFISSCDSMQKILWVFGAAGVGKSAIMQSVAESPGLPVGSPASVFFSINGRDDGTKTIITLSYQLAARSDPYRQVIEQEITRDPALLRSSMAKQFDKLIIEPFMYNVQLKSAGRVAIIIDGLDECKNPDTQLELLRLISDLCLKHPSSPLVWLIASRPEPHITSFFSKSNIIPAYEKEEVPVDSDGAHADVERFLREELAKIKDQSDLLDPRWPDERDFWKVANAAGGLFAYAQTVVNYIGDRGVGSPASQLSDVLRVIDKVSMTGLSRAEHPMALLDALYERILSNVPAKIMINTRKVLIALASIGDSSEYFGHITMSFVVLCNWVGLTADEAYAAVNHLRSVLYVPKRYNALQENIRSFHKSFIDYISDFTRSGLFPHFLDESYHLKAECSSRILANFPNDIRSNRLNLESASSALEIGSAALHTIPLTWLLGNLEDMDIRLNVYKLAIEDLLNGMRRRDQNFWSTPCIRFLASAWSFYGPTFPYYELLNAAFDETRHPEFVMNGILKQIPLEAVSENAITRDRDITFHYRRPASMITNSYHPRTSSCRHEWKAGQAGHWTTTFQQTSNPRTVERRDCASCFEQLQNQLKLSKAQSPDHTALVMFTSTGECCVQFRFVNPHDGMSEWTYLFWGRISQDVHEKHGSNV